jgi:putative ABC transport system permease protein
MTTLLLDVRFALRMLWKHKAFTASALATIGLAIGANTAIFTLVSSVLLQPLPLARPERVMRIEERHTAQPINLTGATFADLKARSRSLGSVAAYRVSSPGFSAGDAPEQVIAAEVSPDYFAVLGVPAAQGRVFAPADFVAGSSPTVILSDGIAQRHFGNRSNALGRIVLVNAVPTEVVGVMPPGHFAPGSPQIWVPYASSLSLLRNRRSHLFTVIARLGDDVSPAAATEEISSIGEQVLADSGNEDAGLTLVVTPLHERMTRAIRPALLMLWGAVGLVLVIAAANIANLLLMQGVSRSRELSIRTALGASRIRLLRQFATEALLLGLTGGAIGTVLGVWSIPALRTVLPATLPRTSEISVTPSVILFGLALSLLTALVFGAAPAVRASLRVPADDLRDRHGETRGQSRLRASFVAAQVGVTVILLTLAALLGRSFLTVTRAQLGFDPSNVVAFDLTLPSARYRGAAAQGEFLGRVSDAMRSIPGVRDAAATGALPMTGTARTTMIPEATTSQESLYADVITASPGFFSTLRIPLLRGRLFTDADSRTGAPVVILNETAVRRYWPDGTDPLGRAVTMRDWGQPYVARVVGIVGDVRQAGPEVDPAPAAYYPVAQFPETLLRHSVIIRTDGDPLSVVAAAREQVWRIDREQPVASIRTLDTILATTLAQRRFNLVLLAGFAATALALAALGLYGIVAFAVGQRSREIGLRVALGARPFDVALMVVAHGVAPIAVGLGLGTAGAFAASKAIEAQFFGVSAADAPTIAFVLAVVTATGALACSAPARRALNINPAVTLRD